MITYLHMYGMVLVLGAVKVFRYNKEYEEGSFC